METYMFISGRRHAPPVAEQIEYAKSKRLDGRHVFGAKQALYRSCRNLNAALQYEDFLQPLDHVYVYDLACIGSSHASILEALDAYHKKHVCLHIVDISYEDLIVQTDRGYRSETGHYDLLSKYLRAFQRLGRTRAYQKAEASYKGRGRPGVPYSQVPADVQALIEKYVNLPKSKYGITSLKRDIRSTAYKIGQERLYKYINQLREEKGLPPRR